MHSSITKVLALGAVTAGALGLSGCAQFSDAAHGEARSHADGRADLRDAPSWLPADATDISTVVGTKSSDPATAPKSMLFTTEDGVTADRCEQVPRMSAPSLTFDEAPDPYAAQEVTKCGAWSMTSRGTRWLAWTPNTEDGK